MKTITIVTATRAEYGTLFPLIKHLEEEKFINLKLIVSGTHLSKEYGYTINEIEEDGVSIDCKMDILEPGNDAISVSKTIANAINLFAEWLNENKTDVVILSGDRTELLGFAIASINANVMIAHIHGGEITKGAIDDSVRHALTKMSYLHFVTTEKYRQRVIQMGENPDRVFNVGSLCVENIQNMKIVNEATIKEILGIPKDVDYILVTYHPETMSNRKPFDDARILCEVFEQMNDFYFIITSANADIGGDAINQCFLKFSETHKNVGFFYNLGKDKYYHTLKNAKMVLGNSSSGIVEAPIMGTPTINIGKRQEGREFAESVICCEMGTKEIIDAIEIALGNGFYTSSLFGKGDTADRITDILLDWINRPYTELIKGFWDLY